MGINGIILTAELLSGDDAVSLHASLVKEYSRGDFWVSISQI